MTDLISRAAAIDEVTRTAVLWGVTGEPAILIATKNAIRALPAVAASQTPDPVVKADSCQSVRVKPLVWDSSGSELISRSFLGSFNISEWRGKVRVYGPSSYLGEYTAIEAAKAAAQADYERRILAAIETQPDPRDAVIAQLVEALDAMLQSVCGPTGFAAAVRHNSGFAFPWHSLDASEIKARAALAAAKGGDA